MAALKKKLDTVRNRIETLDRSKWRVQTRFTNFTGNVVRRLRSAVNPEMCTAGWCKFYELLDNHQLLDNISDQV